MENKELKETIDALIEQITTEILRNSKTGAEAIRKIDEAIKNYAWQDRKELVAICVAAKHKIQQRINSNLLRND